MSDLPINASFYSVGGPLLQNAPSYLTRESDTELYETLKAGKFCYVLNSRQMGKSSLMVRTLAKLEADGWVGSIIDFSGKDSQVDRPDRWYNGIINQLNNQFELLEWQTFRTWLKERDFIAPVERLADFIENVLLPGIEQPIVIFIDEIDSTLGLPFTDDFFALIRVCFNKRPQNPDYQRLTFALLGVAAPSELIGDAKRTPFNVGDSIELKGFTLKEALPLATGLQDKAEKPETVLQEILQWTGGQPFLTQRLCQLVVDSVKVIFAGSEAVAIDRLVNSRLIDNWEAQDNQEHLKTIRKRLLDNEQKARYLLELYRQIRQSGELVANNQPEEQELQLSGLIVKRFSKLQAYNPIYTAIFDEVWIDTELSKLRPYAESFRAWLASEKTDESRLLRGGALTEAEEWGSKKTTLSAEDREFLAASRTEQREEEIAIKEREAELARERTAREAAETAEQIQTKANRQARQKIRQGTMLLGGTLIATILFGSLAFFAGVKLEKVQQEQQEIVEQNKTARILSGLVEELQANDKPEAAEDLIELIGLSFTNFTKGKTEFKEALLNSSIALAHLHLTPLDNVSRQTQIGFYETQLYEAQTRIDASIQLIRDYPNLFSSSELGAGREIAFFTYAVQGNLQEEQDYLREAQELISINSPYRKAFHYTSENPNLVSGSVEDAFKQLLASSSDWSKDTPSQTLVTAVLKKHYDVQSKKLIRRLESALQQYQWREADKLTLKAIMASAYSRNLDFSYSNVACSNLRAIDTLWSKQSLGRFGFRTQQDILQAVIDALGQRPFSQEQRYDYDDELGTKFAHKVGWIRINRNDERIEWLNYDELLWPKEVSDSDLSNAVPLGHLPSFVRSTSWSSPDLYRIKTSFDRSLITFLSSCTL